MLRRASGGERGGRKDGGGRDGEGGGRVTG